MRWIDLANVKKDFEGLKNLVVKEQYLETCSVTLAIFLRERKLTDLDELARLAEQYLEAHASKGVNRKQEKEFEITYDRKADSHTFPSRTFPKVGEVNKTCFNCGKSGHVAKNCFHRKKVAAMEQRYNNRGGLRRPTFNNGRNHSSQMNSNSRAEFSETETARKVIDDGSMGTLQSNRTICKAHHKEMCVSCFELPVHKCNAAKHLSSTEIKLEWGCSIPVIADACKSGTESMPVRDGLIGDCKVSVLRDTGCSTVVIRRSLMSDDQLTGAEETCVLIDGTVRRTPVAEIEINTPYYTGRVKAVCMRNPLYDVIIGNISGAKIEEEITEAQAVVTRSQAQKQDKPTKPLKVVDGVDVNVGRDQLISLQQQDESLKKLIQKAQKEKQDDGSDVEFKLKNGILYRYCKSFDGINVSQVVLPVTLRERALKLAHDTVMSGHQGRKKTKDKIWSQFWWPGLIADVTRFCRSCDICQRTVAKGRVVNVPLGKMSVIDTPFDRVAVDIVGPIHPATEKGNRYILTMVDYATRYPEAEPLKDIHAEAEALVNMFTRVGIPKEILSDQGSQFLSAVMKEMCRLLAVKQLVTTAYHPMCNGLVEKFNGTLKNMLRRLCAEKLG